MSKPKVTVHEMRTKLRAEIATHADSINFTIKQDLNDITSKSHIIDVTCKAKQHTDKLQVLSFMRWTSCMYCKKEADADSYYRKKIPDLDSKLNDEEWRLHPGSNLQVSSLGRVKCLVNNAILCPQDKSERITYMHRPYNISYLIAQAFEVENHHLLDQANVTTCTYVSCLIDPRQPAVYGNVQVTARGSHLNAHIKQPESGNKLVTSTIRKPKPVPSFYAEAEQRVLPEFPHWNIFRNGSIFNNQVNKFVDGKAQGATGRRHIENSQGRFDIARLIVMAYKPLSDRELKYESYKDLHVQFADDNKGNCHVDNLVPIPDFKSIERQRAQREAERLQELHNNIKKFVSERQGELVIDLSQVTSQHDVFKYKCACGQIQTKCYKDVMFDTKCKLCVAATRHRVSIDPSEDFVTQDNVLFKRFNLGWAGSNCVILNNLKEPCVIHNNRVKVAGVELNPKRILAEAFQLPNYQHLKKGDSTYQVFYKDITLGLTLDNLEVCTPSEGTSKYVTKRFDNTCSETDVHGVESRVVADFPGWVFYANGIIRNPGNTLSRGYVSQHRDGHMGGDPHTILYRSITIDKFIKKVHRLICYAFNPIEGFVDLSDYKGLQVDHIDNDKSNNSASNLRWCTGQENVTYYIQAKQALNNTRIHQYTIHADGSKGDLVATHDNISAASQATRVSLDNIRKACLNQLPVQRVWWFELDSEVRLSKKRTNDQVSSSDDDEEPPFRTKVVIVERVEEPVFDDHDVTIVDSATSQL